MKKLMMMLTIALTMSLVGLVGCEDKKDDGKSADEGPKAEAYDEGSMEAGESYTVALKYWMKGSQATETGMEDNLHFDDADNTRVVFDIGDGVADQVEGLEQNKVYSVTFDYKGEEESPVATKIE